MTSTNKPPPVIIRERTYIPVASLLPDLDDVRKKFNIHMFNDNVCKRCPEFENRGVTNPRPTESCLECVSSGYHGRYKLYREITTNDVDFIGIPRGVDASHLYKDTQIMDQRASTSFKVPITFDTSLLYDYQSEAVKVCTGKSGVLKSNARTGKTVMAAAIAIANGYKTLIIASQREWLDNFYQTFVADKEDELSFTNIRDLGKDVCGFAKSVEDFERFDIVLCTPQTFISDIGKEKFNRIKNLFGMVIIDECHGTGADSVLKVVNSINAKHVIGLTATPLRKDGKYPLVDLVIGPVIHETSATTLRPQVLVVNTEFEEDREQWTFKIRAIERDKKLTRLLVQHVIQDVEEGHSIVMPCYFLSQIDTLVKAINKEAGEKIAYPFHGQMSKADRKSTVERARTGEIKVVVGYKQLVSTGINVPAWTCIYEFIPSSNEGGAIQRLNRILTPVEGKKTPVIKYFLLNTPTAVSCFKFEFKQVVLKYLDPIISEATTATIKAYLNVKKKKEKIGHEL